MDVERFLKRRNVLLFLDTISPDKIPEHIQERYPEEVYAFKHYGFREMYQDVCEKFVEYVLPLKEFAKTGVCTFQGHVMKGGRDKLLWKGCIYYAHEYPKLFHGFETIIALHVSGSLSHDVVTMENRTCEVTASSHDVVTMENRTCEVTASHASGSESSLHKGKDLPALNISACSSNAPLCNEETIREMEQIMRQRVGLLLQHERLFDPSLVKTLVTQL
jgi:hypothetical protein